MPAILETAPLVAVIPVTTSVPVVPEAKLAEFNTSTVEASPRPIKTPAPEAVVDTEPVATVVAEAALIGTVTSANV